jgi:hypothetical protein
MKRLPHWERLLAAHFAKAATQRFAWGTFDCALAVCDGINAITGLDPGAPYRGKYATEKDAMALLVGPGNPNGDLGTFAAAVCQAAGFPEWLDKDGKTPRPTFGRRGDVALVNNGGPTPALGTVDLTGRFAWCAAERGFGRVPMHRWLRVWRIA